jgi:hypothetical protein
LIVRNMAFVKLDCNILTSTIWIDRVAREVFLTALLMAEPREITEPMREIKIRSLENTDFCVPPGWYGFVPAAGMGIVRMACVEQEEGMKALERLAAPEAESRTPDFEGRRLVRVDGGFIVLNFQKHRDRDHGSTERGRRFRERKRNAQTPFDNARTALPTQAEAEAEADNTNPSPAAPADVSMPRKQSAPSASPEQTIKTVPCGTIYAAYPRKVGKQDALKAIARVLKTESAERILERTQAYAMAVLLWPLGERHFVPHPATWFNRGSYDDDPETWKRNGNTKTQPANSRSFSQRNDYSGIGQ